MKKYYRDESHAWLKGLSFEDVSKEELLERVLPRVSTRGAAWVLDLDSTLFCVGPRIRDVFLEFLRQHPNAPELWHRALPFMNASIQRYSIEETFYEIFRTWNEREAAAWATKLWTEFLPFWTERFFSNRHLHADEVYPGALNFVESLLKHGFEVIYLTGRDRERTAQGTCDALRVAGFPLGGSAHLMMKPRKNEPDLAFKHRAASLLRSRFEVVAFVDNEPENLVMAAREFPRAEIVLFHTIMSDRVPSQDFRQLLGDRKPLRLLSY